MDQQAQSALVYSQSVACLCELEAMKALNAERADKGLAQAYGEDAFMTLPEKYGLGYNAVVAFFTGRG